MNYHLRIKPEAQQDLAQAMDWYEDQKEGLSIEFLATIDKALESIKANPSLFQERYREIRIVFTRRFPYGIHYTLEEDTIYVHAVLHTHRKPRG
ncbi:type II toxin-antitoxin system RelE/ParE family toxin [Flavobacteriaceae bacterium M23B6Z8]